MASGDFRVADISLADFGRKEIELAEQEVSVYCFKFYLSEMFMHYFNSL